MRIRGLERAPARVLIAVAEDRAMQAVQWRLVGPDRRVVQGGRAEAAASGAPPWPSKIDRTVLIVHGGAVAARRLSLGSGRPPQMRASALFRLNEDGLAGPAEDLSLAWSAVDAEGRRMTAAVERTVLDDWRAQAARLGLAPDVILPDSLCGPAPEGEGWAGFALFDRMVLRDRDRALAVEPDLADLLMADAPSTRMEDAEDVEAILIAAAFDPPVNLLDGRARPAGGWGGGSGGGAWRAAAALGVLVALSPLAQAAAEAIRYEMAADQLDRRSAAVMRRLWPDAAPAADPAGEVRARLGPQGGAGSFAGDAATLFGAIEQMEGVQVQMLALEEDGALGLSLAHPDPADMAHLKTALEALGLTLTEEGMGEENGRALSNVRVFRR